MPSPRRSILRPAIQRLIGVSTPRQLAAGFTLGMILGLVPKGNLIAISLCAMLFTLRVNKGLAVAAAIVFSFASPWADSLTHKLGAIALSVESLQPLYAWLYALPLGPWLGFHNTVVTGSLLVGVYLAYPAYCLVNAAFCRMQSVAADAEVCELDARRWEAYPQNKPLHGGMP
ncbi:MAG TPA: TIGR03546 family protein [Lacipirellulaceae bacterium]